MYNVFMLNLITNNHFSTPKQAFHRNSGHLFGRGFKQVVKLTNTDRTYT